MMGLTVPNATPASAFDGHRRLRPILLLFCGAVALGAFAWQAGIDDCRSLVFLLAGVHLVTEHALFGYEGVRPTDEPEGARRAILIPTLLLAIYAALLRTEPTLAFQIAFAARGVHHAIGYAYFLSETRNPFARNRLTLVGAGGIWLLALALCAAEQRWDIFFLVDFLGHVLAWGVTGVMGRAARSNEVRPRHPENLSDSSGKGVASGSQSGPDRLESLSYRFLPHRSPESLSHRSSDIAGGTVRQARSDALLSAAVALALTLAFLWLAGGRLAPGGAAGSPIGPAGAFAAAWIPHYILEGYALWRRW